VTRILEAHPEAKVIVLGEDRDVDLLLAAVRPGAAGVVGKTCGATTVLRSVHTHIQNVPGKLGMHSKLEAATVAMQCSLEPVPGCAIKLG
jgi:DNA-binding NarL/FixJ family response regulator